MSREICSYMEAEREMRREMELVLCLSVWWIARGGWRGRRSSSSYGALSECLLEDGWERRGSCRRPGMKGILVISLNLGYLKLQIIISSCSLGKKTNCKFWTLFVSQWLMNRQLWPRSGRISCNLMLHLIYASPAMMLIVKAQTGQSGYIYAALHAGGNSRRSERSSSLFPS